MKQGCFCETGLFSGGERGGMLLDKRTGLGREGVSFESAEAISGRPCALLSARAVSELIKDQFINAPFGERASHDAQLQAAALLPPCEQSAD